jgi:hypothetical protein
MEESSSQELMTKFIDIIDSPEAISDENLVQWSAGNNKIYDADGDGVEDNKHLTSDQLDKFYKPNRFFPTEHIHNTRNGELPGHHRWGDHPEPGTNPHAEADAKDAAAKAAKLVEEKKQEEASKKSFLQTE